MSNPDTQRTTNVHALQENYPVRTVESWQAANLSLRQEMFDLTQTGSQSPHADNMLGGLGLSSVDEHRFREFVANRFIGNTAIVDMRGASLILAAGKPVAAIVRPRLASSDDSGKTLTPDYFIAATNNSTSISLASLWQVRCVECWQQIQSTLSIARRNIWQQVNRSFDLFSMLRRPANAVPLKHPQRTHWHSLRLTDATA